MKNLLPYIEYGLGPLLLVVATVSIKLLIKDSARIKWMESLAIGIDLIMMCVFGAFIYGLGVYNHFADKPESSKLLVFCLLFLVVSLVFALFLAVLIRNWGETSKKAFWIPNILSLIFLTGLLMLVSNGSVLLENNSKKNETKKAEITQPTN